jgi:hypothetical protein
VIKYYITGDKASEELEVDAVEKKLAQYKEKWLNHVSRMDGRR